MALPPRQTRRSNPNRTFRFLDLPAELRNHIYEDALVLSQAYWKSSNDASSSPEPKNTGDDDDEQCKFIADSCVVPLSSKKHASVSNDMYAFTLCCGEDLSQRRVQTFPHCGCKATAHALDEHGYELEVFPDKSTKSGPHPSHNLALGLLRACRQTHAEGASILYGSNAFNAETRTLQYFLLQIGDMNAALLRRLCITDFFDGPLHYSTLEHTICSILNWDKSTSTMYHGLLACRYYILGAATNLDTLELSHTGLWKELKPVDLANYVVSQLGYWMKECAKNNRKPKVACLETILFVWYWSGCDCYGEFSMWEEVCDKSRSKLRESFVTLLKSADESEE